MRITPFSYSGVKRKIIGNLLCVFLLEQALPVPINTPYFSNECNMLNRIVLGKTAKEVREEHGLKKGTSIRPYLTNEEIEAIDQLQRVDIGLLISTPDFQQRKQYLEWYYMKKFQ